MNSQRRCVHTRREASAYMGKKTSFCMPLCSSWKSSRLPLLTLLPIHAPLDEEVVSTFQLSWTRPSSSLEALCPSLRAIFSCEFESIAVHFLPHNRQLLLFFSFSPSMLHPSLKRHPAAPIVPPHKKRDSPSCCTSRFLLVSLS